MDEDDNLSRSDRESKHDTQVLLTPGQTDQGVESENSSGSVYHSSLHLLTENEDVEGRQTRTPTATSESDSDQHFSDAIQDSDAESVYSAEDNQFAVAEEDTINLAAHSSHDQCWSPSASRVSVLPKQSDADKFTSKIPLPTHVGNCSSNNSFKFQQAIEKAEGSLIPVPIRFRDISPELQRTKSDPTPKSRSASPDKDVPSSESENLTAISVKAQNNDGASLEKYKSDDLLGDPVSFPLDSPEVQPDCPQATTTTTRSVDDQNNEDVISTMTQDSDASTFTITDVSTHRYESENDGHRPKNATVAFTEVKFSAQPYDLSDNEDLNFPDEKSCSDATQNDENSLNVVLETIQMIDLDSIQRETYLPPPKIDCLQVVNDPSGHDASSIALLAPIASPVATELVASPEHPASTKEPAPTEQLASTEVPTTEQLALAEQPATTEQLQATAVEPQLLQNNSIADNEPTNDESRITSEDQTNDDDYVEIEEEPSQKKLTRFGKLKSKLARRSSSKEVNIRKLGANGKTTLKVRRKPPNLPGSRPSSAKHPSTPPKKTSPSILRPKGNTIPQSKVGSIRASIKHEANKLKEEETGVSIKKRSNSDVAIVKRNDSFIELKDGRSSSHSIRDIFQDLASPSSKDIKTPLSSPSVKTVKTKVATKEEQAVKSLTPVNQSKLNNIVSRYRIQLKKLNSQVSDMTELQNKTGLLHESLTHMKSQIVAIAGALPTYLNDVPHIPVLTTTTSSGSNTECTSAVASAYEDLLTESLALKNDNSRMVSTINTMKKDFKALRDENSALKESLSSNKTQMNAQLKAYEEKLAAMEAHKDDASKSKRLVENFRRKYEALSTTMNETKVMYEEEKSRRAENEKALLAEVQALKNRQSIENSKRESMKQILAKLTDEKENLELQVASLNQTVKELKQKLSNQEKEFNTAREIQIEYVALEEDFRNLEKELAESKKYCESLASRIDSSEKAEEESSKKLIKLSEEVMDKIQVIQKLSDIKLAEEKRRRELYKIISDLSAFTGNKIDAEEIQRAAEKEQCEFTNPIVKIFEELEGVINTKNAEIERQKQVVADLQNLHQEKQSLIEQLYEFVNEKNASICRRSESRDMVSDNKEEEKTAERSSNLNTLEGQPSLKDHPDFQDLYNMLEVKRHTLLKMESQIRRLQEVHAYCGMRRTMQESRIAELETMLASVLVMQNYLALPLVKSSTYGDVDVLGRRFKFPEIMLNLLLKISPGWFPQE